MFPLDLQGRSTTRLDAIRPFSETHGGASGPGRRTSPRPTPDHRRPGPRGRPVKRQRGRAVGRQRQPIRQTTQQTEQTDSIFVSSRPTLRRNRVPDRLFGLLVFLRAVLPTLQQQEQTQLLRMLHELANTRTVPCWTRSSAPPVT